MVIGYCCWLLLYINKVYAGFCQGVRKRPALPSVALGFPRPIVAWLRLFHATAVVLVGPFTRHRYEVDAVRRIDLCYRARQFPGWTGVARCKVDAGQLGKAETFLLCPYACGPRKQQDAGNQLICLGKG